MLNQISQISITEYATSDSKVDARRLKNKLNEIIKAINDLEERLDNLERKLR